MKLPKSVPGVNRGMSALRGYIGQVGVEPSCTPGMDTSDPKHRLVVGMGLLRSVQEIQRPARPDKSC